MYTFCSVKRVLPELYCQKVETTNQAQWRLLSRRLHRSITLIAGKYASQSTRSTSKVLNLHSARREWITAKERRSDK